MGQDPDNDRTIPSPGEVDYRRKVEALFELIVQEELAELKEQLSKATKKN
jgi:hypothetical protein